MRAMAENYTALRQLQLKSFKSSTSLGTLWKGIGAALESLSIETSSLRLTALDLDSLAAECKRMFEIALLGNIWSNRENAVQFFKECGSRLRFLKLSPSGLDNELVRQLRTACPNSEFCVFNARAPFSLPCDDLVVLGEALANLSISWPLWKNSTVIEALGRVGDVCPNLQHCHVNTVHPHMDAFRALFDVPKPKLSQVVVRVSDEVSSTPANIFRILAESVSSIEEFTYAGHSPPANLLAPFVAANRLLRKVKLTLPVDDACQCNHPGEWEVDEHRVDWRPFVTPFFHSESLLELDCSFRKPAGKHFAVRYEICFPARPKGISVSICNYQYW